MRENYDSCNYPGKFEGETPMTEFVWSNLLMNGDDGDESYSDEFVGDWANRYGRRVLMGDDRGFVTLVTFPTPQDAAGYMP